MPRNAEDVENFLYQLNRHFERDQDSFVVSSGAGRPPVAVMVADPIVVVRTAIGEIPEDVERQNAVFKQLLRYNGTDLVHATYALEDDHRIVLTAGLELENLDLNELAAVLSDIEVALARHVSTLRALATGTTPPASQEQTAS